MTRLFNDPADFAEEARAGFVAANSGYVRSVPGGVARATRSAPGGVALVVGGGSGHYPAFAGLVGPGLAHGAAMGNLFASPSTQQVHAVARAAEHGGGVLLSYGNYAGDVLNFDAAQARLREEGIPCETVRVTDDISSAPLSEKHKRRGIAGDLVVFKVAGAAAEDGAPLAEVARLARLANERTRSFGVAFGGCTLPGAVEPLFTVPEGRMAVGLGIHGEPGIAETVVPPAAELARQMVDALLAELPDGIASVQGARVVPILNGLGSLKYEELFVVYAGVAAAFVERGVQVVDPQVGEFCTSFDMAGLSLTLLWLDDELEPLWLAPVDTPAYRRGSIGSSGERIADAEEEDAAVVFPPASEAAVAAAPRAADAVAAALAAVEQHAEQLGRWDAIAGDGDHGIGMLRGATAADEAARIAVSLGAGAGSVLRAAGDAWADRAGGTSGALWGVALRALGDAVGDDEAPDAAALAAGCREALRRIQDFGKAQLGDKTMVDAIAPFVDELTARVGAGERSAAAWAHAGERSLAAAEATAQLLPKMGRARPHAEKSLGVPDPGAMSFAYIVQAVGGVLETTGATHA